MNRYNLSITAETTSVARMVGFNRAKVDMFFDIYREQVPKHHYSLNMIHNMDESSFTTVQKPDKVIAEKGSRVVEKATSAERGQLVTVNH